jgi:hypothetical protein
MKKLLLFARGLFQSIDGFHEAHDSRCSILYPSRLAHIHLLLEVCVEERDFDVCRVHMHVPFGSDGHHRTQCAELDEWRERLSVCDPCTLTEPLGNQSRLEAAD